MIKQDFFARPAKLVAKDLLGKNLCVQQNDAVWRGVIFETEAYIGEHDLASHASKGRTERTDVMYGPPGNVYMYLIYGMYWMLNFVCAPEGDPQAVLVRGAGEYDGPGKLTKALGINKSINSQPLNFKTGVWIEDIGSAESSKIIQTPRIGVDYAKEWSHELLRFVLKNE